MTRRRIAWSVMACVAGLAVVTAAAGDLIFEDYFVHELRSWDPLSCCWTVVGYENGKLLRQKSSEPKLINTRIVIAERSFDDCVVETKVRFGAYPGLEQSDDVLLRLGAGIVFGYQDDENYYLFRLASDDRVVLGKVVKGEWKELGSKAARKPSDPRVEALEDAPWYTLGVTLREGDHISCSVDGEPMIAAEGDEEWGTGKVGLTTWNAMADFAYVKVSRP